MHPSDRATLGELREAADRLGERLERRQIGGAAEAAQRLAGGAEELRGELGLADERELDLDRSRRLGAAQDNLGLAGRLAHEVLDALRSVAPDGEQALDAAERKDVRRLERRQGELAQDLKRLDERLGELDEDAPGLRASLRENLDGAARAMDEAGERLDAEAPREAERHQREALEELGEARREVERQMRRAEGRREAAGVGVTSPRRRVEIPAAEDHRAPAAFRAELLRAMKERAPERFREAIERYYRELVK